MPDVLVAPIHKYIAVNGNALDITGMEIEFPPNLFTITWTGEPETGHGMIEFTDDYNQALMGSQLYNEDVKPYVDIFLEKMAEIEEGQRQAAIETEQRLYGVEARFYELRRQRDEKLQLEYDAAIAQFNRKKRTIAAEQDKNALNEELTPEQKQEIETSLQQQIADIDKLILEWDEYAKKLCKLPEQEGAPWDFRITEGPGSIPWPTPPSK